MAAVSNEYTPLMLSDLQLFGLGAAAVVDTVLLVALIERPNRRHVAIWMARWSACEQGSGPRVTAGESTL